MLIDLKKKKDLFLIVGVLLIAFLLGLSGSSLVGATGGSLSGAAGALANQVACDTSSLLGTAPSGIVLADPLNLRTGPGLNYQVITTLNICSPISLLGRNGDYTWVEVSLPGNVGGWVFIGYKTFPYVQTNINISDLPLTTASGGAVANPPASSDKATISVIIQANQVAAFASGMPANATISATLNPSTGSGNGVAVASGKSDAHGNITLTFPMPKAWADGSALTSGTMTLTLAGKGKTAVAYITYYAN